ncbi:MAG TPA: GNAT family N-acetyltransferase [Stellaceae bacterium]|nr:GNAT family N-acetyltransferase [Stellaceae bacterium]
MNAVAIRDSRSSDMAAIAAIYGHHVRHGFGSFEEEAPSAEELERRRQEILAKGLPYLVAEGPGGEVFGYAYASPYRTRSAYRFTLENSIYVAPERGRGGIGRALLTALIERCTALGYREMIAVIGDSANAASIGLHRSMGFVRAGVLRSVGYKRGRWVDGVLMQRALGEGDTTPPRERESRSVS